MKEKIKPYLSLVVSSRNDNHGGDMMKRMLIFVRGLMHLSLKYELPIELIFVEWNPPKENPLLKDVLPGTKGNPYLDIRYIIVPEEIHLEYHLSYAMPLFQMIAKNVGIKRAKADFICCTNVDLLFSEEMFEILKKRKLDKNAFYRANRCDIPNDMDENWSYEKQIEYAKSHIVERIGKNPEFIGLINMPQWVYSYKWFARILNKFMRWFRAKYYPIRHQLLELDTHACGDFTMMHRDAWEDMGGYLELDLYSIHIDTIGIAQAKALGYNQVVFPEAACTYHIEHGLGWKSGLNPLEMLRFYNKRPGLGFHTVEAVINHLIETGENAGLNPKTWGFSDRKFEEYHT